MRRRTFLASSAALVGTPIVGRSAATSSDFGPLGTTPIQGAMDAVTDGRTAYVAASTGFASVDVTDPTAPTVLADRRSLLSDLPDGPLTGVYDIALDGDRLVVAGPADPKPDAFHGLGIYDVSDPGTPERVGVYQTDFPVHNLDVADGHAFLTGNDGARNPLVVVSIDREEPAEIGRWSLLDVDERWGEVAPRLRVLHDVTIRGERAYLAHWDAGTWIVDVRDPTAMSVLARVRGRPIDELAAIESERARHREYLQLPGNDHTVAVDDDGALLAIGAEAWDVTGDDRGGGPGGVELWDVAATPQHVATIEPPATSDPTIEGVWTTAHNLDVADDLLFSSWYRGGVRVHDVSDPRNPRRVAAWADRRAASFFTARHAADRSFFVASSMGVEGTGGALYTFPVAPGATELTTATTTAAESCIDGACPPATTERPTAVEPDDAPTTEPETESAATTVEGAGPGFGALAALAALLSGGWYARRGDRD